jgi:hypothetical protein
MTSPRSLPGLHPQDRPIKLMEKMEKMKVTPVHIKDLPTELIEFIATHLDDQTLIAIKSASPNLRQKTYYVFGQRLFSRIPIAMNPIGLQALQDIAYIPDLAKYVRILHFSWTMTMTDPLHDSEVIHRNFEHTLPISTPKRAPDVLRKHGVRANALRILRALPKLQKLEIINYGHILGSNPTGFIGVHAFRHYKCPTGHCDPTVDYSKYDEVLLQCMSEAVNQAHKHSHISESVKIGFGRCYRFRLPAPTQPVQLPNDPHIQAAQDRKIIREAFGDRPCHLKLELSIGNVHHAYPTEWTEWQKSHINSLDVVYNCVPLRPFGNELAIRSLPLGKLQELSLQQLWTRATTLEQFIWTYLNPDRMTKVYLIRCSVRARGVISDFGSWRGIIDLI